MKNRPLLEVKMFEMRVTLGIFSWFIPGMARGVPDNQYQRLVTKWWTTSVTQRLILVDIHPCLRLANARTAILQTADVTDDKVNIADIRNKENTGKLS